MRSKLGFSGKDVLVKYTYKLKTNLIPEKITKADFSKTISNHKFDLKEKFRSQWYYLISERLNVYRANKPRHYKMSDDEAILYIAFISQWNRANRKITTLDYLEFKQFMATNTPKFIDLESERIETLQMKNNIIKEAITNLTQELTYINGVGRVGATKILHMRLPALFVPLDNAIAKQDTYKVKKTKDFGNAYFDFLCTVSHRFNNVFDAWNTDAKINVGCFGKKKTFAKAIDEYNFLKVHTEET